MFDVISVAHKDEFMKLAEEQRALMDQIEEIPFTWIQVDNRINNVGFAKGCNIGVSHGENPYIALLNPDLLIDGPFLRPVLNEFEANESLVITGERFDKPDYELAVWGCKDWVCGAAFFVRRAFWELIGGFDEQFVWSWEESDMIRQAQALRRDVKSIRLPLRHETVSPSNFDPKEAQYKNHWFSYGARYYYGKWNPYGRR